MHVLTLYSRMKIKHGNRSEVLFALCAANITLNGNEQKWKQQHTMTEEENKIFVQFFRL